MYDWTTLQGSFLLESIIAVRPQPSCKSTCPNACGVLYQFRIRQVHRWACFPPNDIKRSTFCGDSCTPHLMVKNPIVSASVWQLIIFLDCSRVVLFFFLFNLGVSWFRVGFVSCWIRVRSVLDPCSFLRWTWKGDQSPCYPCTIHVDPCWYCTNKKKVFVRGVFFQHRLLVCIRIQHGTITES